MPTYDYKCPDCGHEFEEFQTMTAKPLRKCPKCGKRRVKRLIGTGLQPIFKGSGFYETDYVKKSGSKDEADSKPAKATTTSEAKPEAKTETKPAESKPAKPEKKATKNPSK